jgi:hypothetical protein
MFTALNLVGSPLLLYPGDEIFTSHNPLNDIDL